MFNDWVFYRDNRNYKTIVFEGTTEECEEYVKENETCGSYELEVWSKS